MFTNTTVNSSVLPAMAVRGIVPLPNNEIRLEVGRKESILALKEAASSNKYIALFVQKNPNVEKPTQEDVYKEGLVVKILYVYCILYKIGSSSFNITFIVSRLASLI